MKKAIAVLVMGLLIIGGGYCAAEDDIVLFAEKIVYNIYLCGEYETVIRDVEIVDQGELNGRAFLVIKPSGFSVSEDRGYINFDSVAAILPRTKYRVEAKKKSHLLY